MLGPRINFRKYLIWTWGFAESAENNAIGNWELGTGDPGDTIVLMFCDWIRSTAGFLLIVCLLVGSTIAAADEGDRIVLFDGSGLQLHDEGSIVMFRNIWLRDVSRATAGQPTD